MAAGARPGRRAFLSGGIRSRVGSSVIGVTDSVARGAAPMARVGRFEIQGGVGAFEIVTYFGRRAPGRFEFSCIELRDAEVIESVVGVLGRPGAQDRFDS